MGIPEGRRAFLKFLGAGVSGAVWTAAGLPAAAATSPLMPFQPEGRAARHTDGLTFTPILPSRQDALGLPPEFTYDIVALWGDPLPGTDRRFGFNADFTAFFPIGPSGTEGVLWVNHEYATDPKTEFSLYRQTFLAVRGHEPSVADEMHDVGGSVLHLTRVHGRWTVTPSPLTRRYDAFSTLRPTGPALAQAGSVGGTLANCSGCHTPWNTVLSCEENFQDLVPEAVDTAGRGTVGGRFNRNGAHFGWVCEFDPLDPDFVPVKHTALGRFRHENVALRTAPGAPVVAYMGDDRIDGHVYKFVSSARFVPGSPRNRGALLSDGRIFAAVFHDDGTGAWRELAPATPLAPHTGSPHPAIPAGATTLGGVYASQGAIVTDAFHASNLAGATECGRPEDIEVHPGDQSVYIAFTASAERGAHLFSNPYGEIWRIAEVGDGTGLRFTWSRWKAGGPNDAARAGQVFAAPDNLSFDRAGNLWLVTDMSSKALASRDPLYSTFANNGLFYVPLSGSGAGVPLQFASGPAECEMTGPSWTPDEHTLFLSVQHPGEGHGMRTSAPESRGSNWPSTVPNTPPRPGVVAIRRR